MLKSGDLVDGNISYINILYLLFHIPTFIKRLLLYLIDVFMVVNIDRIFSKRATRFRSSEIRELLKITQIPGMITNV